jgi:hypothetical protein
VSPKAAAMASSSPCENTISAMSLRSNVSARLLQLMPANGARRSAHVSSPR